MAANNPFVKDAGTGTFVAGDREDAGKNPFIQNVPTRQSLPPKRPSLPPYPFGPEKGYVGSVEFKNILLQSIVNPDTLTAAEKKQVDSAIANFPELQGFTQQVSAAMEQPEAPEPVQEFVKGLEVAGRKIRTDATIIKPPFPKNLIMPLLIEAGQFYKEAVADFNLIRLVPGTTYDSTTTTLSEDLNELFQRMHLGPVSKEDAQTFIETLDPKTGEIVKSPISESGRIGINIARAAIRFMPQILAAVVENPLKFIGDLVEFPFLQLDKVNQAIFGNEFIMDEEGNVIFQAITEEEQDEAIEEIIQEPGGVAALGLMFYGGVRGAAKARESGDIITNKSKIVKLLDDAKKAEEDATLFKQKFEQQQRATESQLAKIKKIQRREYRKGVVGEFWETEISRIKELTEGGLRSELLEMQEFATDKFSAAEIAGMDRNQVEHYYSGERIPLEKPDIQIQPKVEKPDVPKFGEEARIVEELIFPELVEKAPVEKPPATTTAPIVREAETAARILKIRYNGQRELPDGRSVELFTDPKTGIGFEVKDITEVAQKLQEVRTGEAEALLQKDKAENESQRVALERREREIGSVTEEISQGAKLARAQAEDLVADIKRFDDLIAQFEETLPDLKGAAKENVVAAVDQFKKNQAAVGKDLDIALKDLKVAREEANLAPDPIEKEVAARKVEEAAKERGGFESETGKGETKEARQATKHENVKAVQKERKAEEAEAELRDAEEQSIADQTDRVRMETESEPGPKAIEDTFKGKQQFEMTPMSELHPDPARFQTRVGEKFAEETVNSIVSDFKAGNLNIDLFEPIWKWLDPVDGKWRILSNSRYEAARRLNLKDVPTLKFEGTEKEAKAFADISNKMATPENMISQIASLRRLRETSELEGKELVDMLKSKFRGNYTDYDAMSHLNPTGKIIEVVSQRAFDDFPFAKKFAVAIGKLRREYPQLTNRHEQQIFDQLYPTDGNKPALYNKIGVPDLMDMVHKQVTDLTWKADNPIKLREDKKPMTGTRAAANTTAIHGKIEELKRLRDESLRKKVATDESLKLIHDEITKLEEAMREITKTQTTMDLFSGIPVSEIPALFQDAYRGMRGAIDHINDIIAKTKMTPELKAGLDEGLTAMRNHARLINEAHWFEQALSKKFNDLVSEAPRRILIIDALQITDMKRYSQYMKQKSGLEIDPSYNPFEQLTPFEKGVHAWMKEIRGSNERLKIDNELVDQRKMPPGVDYLFQWWKNEETGKPFNINYGKYSKSLPQAKQRTYDTYLEGRLLGKEMATNNLGTIIGKDFETAITAHATRELVKHLNEIPIGIEKPLSDVPSIAQKLEPGEAGESRPMLVENWHRVNESAMAEEYVRIDDVPFLKKPIVYKNKHGKKVTLEGPVAFHESIALQAGNFFAKPRFQTMNKIMTIAKSTFLTGPFHYMTTGIIDLFMGRIPPLDVIKGGRIKWDLDNPTTRLLARNGLKAAGYDELGFNPTDIFFTGKTKIGRGAAATANVALSPLYYANKIMFDGWVNNMQWSMAYDFYTKNRHKWTERHPDLPIEVVDDMAARESVKQATNFMSHEDVKLAVLETNRMMNRFYYSTTGKFLWNMGLISPSWQLQHLRGFGLGVKGLIPKKVIKSLGIAENSPQANVYRRYIAGIGLSYALMNLENFIVTKQMDGEGKFIFQNPPGKNAFHMRAPWNNPDDPEGKKGAYIHGFKALLEVFEALYYGGKTILGDGDALKKFTGKLAPWWRAAFGTFVFNVDEYGNKIYEKRSFPEKILDFTRQTFEPISLQAFAKLSEQHKAPIGAIVSAFGFPVSKGYPGGAWGKNIDEFRGDRRLSREELRDLAFDKVVRGVNGEEGELVSAMIIMSTQLNMSDGAIIDEIERLSHPLNIKFDKMPLLDKIIYVNQLAEMGKLEEFLLAVEKDAGIRVKKDAELK